MKKVLVSFFILSLSIFSTFARWSDDPAVNNRLTANDCLGYEAETTPDGVTYVVYSKLEKTGITYYLQIVRADGTLVFADLERKISEESNRTYNMYGGYSLLVDDDGNAVVTISDARNTKGTILVPVLDDKGNPVYDDDGNPVTEEVSLMELSYAAYKFSPEGVSLWEDVELTRGYAYNGVTAMKSIQLDNGDYVFAWQAWESDSRMFIMMEKLSKTGKLLWSAPKTLSEATRSYSFPYLVDANYGDYILVYTRGTEVYANKFSFDDEPVWANPVTVYRGGFTLSQHLCFDVIPDQKGGVIAGWYDDRKSSNVEKVYVQHINSDGTNAYVTSEEGLRISYGRVAWSPPYPDVYESLRAFRPHMTYDPVNDVLYAAYEEHNNAQSYRRVVMQKVNGDGDLMWSDHTDYAEPGNVAGFEISVGEGNSFVELAGNGNIAVFGANGSRYYAALYNPTDDVPTAIWPGTTKFFATNGSSKGSLQSSQLIDGKYFITTWGDQRNAPDRYNAGIYAQKLNLNGSLGNFTEVQKKNVLLEVFTGIHCGNCPDGDVVTDNFITARPEIVYAIDVHAGHYAVPNSGQPDYRTDEGEWIDSVLLKNEYGYPGGALNRQLFTDTYSGIPSYIISRSDWIKTGKSIHGEDAPVNLRLKSAWDGESRELTVTVEGYYTAPVEQAEHYLHVALLQDNILGPQNGSSLGNNYNHRHTLRGFLSRQEGDTIYSPQQGEYFKRDYTYILPEAIRNVPVDPDEIELVAFVSAEKEVLNVTGGKPEYLNYSKPLAAVLQYPKQEMPARYGYHFFDAVLKNESSHTLTTAGFEVKINNETQNVTWKGTILPFHTEPIRIKVASYTVGSNNTYEIQLTSLNGTTVTGNKLEGTFVAPAESTPKIYAEIKTDSHADENRFLIKDRNGYIVHEFGPYPAGTVETYRDSIELEPAEIYCFEVIDLWGNGILDPRGSIKLYKDNSKLLAQQYEVTVFGEKFFIQTTLPPTSTAIPTYDRQMQTKVTLNARQKTAEVSFFSQAAGRAMMNVYSVTGKLFLHQPLATSSGLYRTTFSTASFPPGVYLLNIVRNEKRETVKLLVY
jgi:hypothetical protein